uniref:Uncharacterized protein n=1 Tax=Rhizophora mucronata TaxID=61149 RepID=A0A2P2PEJ9_RHIMU
MVAGADSEDSKRSLLMEFEEEAAIFDGFTGLVGFVSRSEMKRKAKKRM